MLARLPSVRSKLVPEASSTTFEIGLEDLGNLLGFSAERPESRYEAGPEVIWLSGDTKSFVLEAKRRKLQEDDLTKGEHGQALTSKEWFESEYPEKECELIIAHPNAMATRNVSVKSARALTFNGLARIVQAVDSSYEELVAVELAGGLDINVCQNLLEKHKLAGPQILDEFTEQFSAQS
jgi:hypothetical protein